MLSRQQKYLAELLPHRLLSHRSEMEKMCLELKNYSKFWFRTMVWRKQECDRVYTSVQECDENKKMRLKQRIKTILPVNGASQQCQS